MKKYINPEYANVVIESNDVITTSLDITKVEVPGNANYEQYKHTTRDPETREVLDVTTVVYGDVGVLLGQ